MISIPDAMFVRNAINKLTYVLSERDRKLQEEFLKGAIETLKAVNLYGESK